MSITTFIVVVIVAGGLVGLAKGGLGGVGAVITPLVVLAIPRDISKLAVGMVLMMLIVGDWFALYAYWKRWEAWRMRLLLLGALVGILAGTTLLANLPSGALRKLIGVLGLLMAAYKAAESRLAGMSYRPKEWHAVLAGGASGFASSLSNAGGPPFSAYMLLQDVNPHTFVGTTTLFFAVVNMVKVPFYLGSDVLRFDLLPVLLPGMLMVPVGVWAGKKIVDYINRRVFEALMWVGLIVSSLVLLLS